MNVQQRLFQDDPDIYNQTTVICRHLSRGGSHILNRYDRTMDHNRMDTVGDQFINENRDNYITKLNLIVVVFASA